MSDKNIIDINSYVTVLSKDLRVPKNKVELVIKEYIKLCRETLLKNNTIIIPNLCSISNKYNTEDSVNYTTGYFIQQISENLGYSYINCEYILNNLFMNIKQDVIYNRNIVIIRGLFKIWCDTNEEDNITIHLNKTTALRNTDIQIHTCKWLKQEVRNAG